jgi:hypothetical protein
MTSRQWAKALSKKHIFFVEAVQPEGKAWYYLQVLPQKLAQFQHTIGKEPLVLSEYGTVLHSGWGVLPLAMQQGMERLIEENRN